MKKHAHIEDLGHRYWSDHMPGLCLLIALWRRCLRLFVKRDKRGLLRNCCFEQDHTNADKSFRLRRRGKGNHLGIWVSWPGTCPCSFLRLMDAQKVWVQERPALGLRFPVLLAQGWRLRVPALVERLQGFFLLSYQGMLVLLRFLVYHCLAVGFLVQLLILSWERLNKQFPLSQQTDMRARRIRCPEPLMAWTKKYLRRVEYLKAF